MTPIQQQLPLEESMANQQNSGDLFSIGHSNYSIETFIGYLKQHNIEGLVDVRSKPFSRYSPHFNRDELKTALNAAGIRYTSRPALGGMSKLKIHDAAFINEMNDLCKAADSNRLAMMCAERNPMDCHRAYKLSAWILRNTERDIHHIHPNGILAGKGIDQRLVAESGQPDKGLDPDFLNPPPESANIA